MRTCSIPNCTNKHRRNGYCALHSHRIRRNASPYLKVLSLSEKFWSRVTKTETCWIWVGSISTRGYGSLTVNKKRVWAHRLSWELSNGPIPNDLWVLHKCDVRACVRPDHLFLGTHQDNMRDMRLKGRSAPAVHNYAGERNPHAKLTKGQAMRVKFGSERVCDLSREFKVPQSTLQGIRSGKRWKHLTIEGDIQPDSHDWVSNLKPRQEPIAEQELDK